MIWVLVGHAVIQLQSADCLLEVRTTLKARFDGYVLVNAASGLEALAKSLSIVRGRVDNRGILELCGLEIDATFVHDG